MKDYTLSDKLKYLEDFSKQVRHHLHTIPEASGVEYKTSEYCKKMMQSFGYKIVEYPGYTGFHADLDIDPQMKRIAFRADMDGLEMPDMTDTDYKSVHDNMAHNCGHDSHMTVALTAARFLAEHPEELRFNVRFIFQMAEEDMRVPGAETMVAGGCVNGVDEIYALHNDASLEVGSINVNDNIMSSWGAAWTLDVNGVSAHGSTPQKGRDAIREVVRIIDDLDYIVAKKTNPFSPAVFGCGMIHGGTVPNAIPDYVQARGTIRSMDEETDTILKNSLTSIMAESALRGFKTNMVCTGYPAVINHKYAYQRIVDSASGVLTRINKTCKPMTGSEDFSYMINAVPEKKGALFFLASGCAEKGINNYLHSNPYYLDDDCLLIGAQIFVNLATHA
ncbi:M20 metallopeptidase family protein [Shimwellia blattae]|uniref:Putative peptidase n=1 Tax=Shimwellia blattae (strain ATCC 29907 / DSM 4481 / JCM 1650 / NBRC 105725 / CDC 9005-74) TaxID=630626 RepID=I2BDQ8_SHIBC|nr:M20 family metallopeptidase [Shimwellia blattae]AFJ48662.1 putative peptidase [Shimwellia blattae DSM 4481 = NBRC 105725]GAB81302.1 aminobenzoyl-glutamate utilization protein A [Shimwellia blattae DSM 4481 = NBRC 105725]VDY66153.1 N-acetyldiaminopimelate deacetylase [Shimwellia blattae]VEC27132.1 N-acetyldiaminopimelate deacetylase [Shimwellia blattae]